MIYPNARFTLLACALILVACLVILSGCQSMTEEKMSSAGGLLLKYQLEEDYKEIRQSRWYGVPWVHETSKEAEIDNDRMPIWANEEYDLCVYWEDEIFSEREGNPRPGPEPIVRREGKGWGWILVNRELETHILETGFQWSVSEDGVETQSLSRTIIDAWDNPSQE